MCVRALGARVRKSVRRGFAVSASRVDVTGMSIDVAALECRGHVVTLGLSKFKNTRRLYVVAAAYICIRCFKHGPLRVSAHCSVQRGGGVWEVFQQLIYTVGTFSGAAHVSHCLYDI